MAPKKKGPIAKFVKKKRDEAAFKRAKKIAATRIKAGKKKVKKVKNDMGY